MRISDWSSVVCSSDLDKVALPRDRQLRTDPKKSRERDALEQRPCVEVDLVLQARITRRIGRRHIVDPHRAAVGQHDPLPDDQCSLLPKCNDTVVRSEEHTSELQSLMRIPYAVFCLKKK